MLYRLLRPLLFRLDPELAHQLAFGGLDLAAGLGLAGCLGMRTPGRPVRVMDLEFPNAVGLAAGLDKNGEHLDALGAMGFGFIEIGTVTPRPQSGNPRPRLFRLPEADALINRMGFNNQGVEAVLANVSRSRYRGILGINIGKNADTPIESAADDYLTCLRKVYGRASYVVVNISSPNTKNLRDLQAASSLDALLAVLKAEQHILAREYGRYVPMAVKIAPDLDEQALRAIAAQLLAHQIDAVIATNTTLSRAGVEGLPHAEESGGLSGRPVFKPATKVLRILGEELAGKLPIIGVGGIFSAEDARAKVTAGASLVQVYTGFVYRGPNLVAECARALAEPSARDELRPERRPAR
ncbi:MAG: quinone-dependent dihydroorotate dehydrogenase [Betaproteobacteria bacterium]|nr:quinone-dependent dihydroorotate dehydrogenase [Betaproteobacteria bacterium]